MHPINRRILYLVTPLLLLTLFVATSGVSIAQDTAPEPAATVSPNEIKEVAEELWCPLCSGVRLDACELKACEQMRDVIKEKLDAGEPKQDIKDYFVAQYGPQVLGEPPLEGFNWLAWLLPVAVLIGGGAFVWYRARGMISSKKAEPTTVSSTPSSDEYTQRLEEELKRYD